MGSSSPKAYSGRVSLTSLLLGLTSLLLMVLGVVFSLVPVLGSVLSFSAPLCALAGLVTGGVAMSRAGGQTPGLAIAGVVLSAIGFLLSLVAALTCGLCNACMSTAVMDDYDTSDYDTSGGGWAQQPTSPSPTSPSAPTAPSAPTTNTPTDRAASGATPPPLPPGFGRPATAAIDACEKARSCCLAFTNDDPTLCDSSLSAASQQPDPARACRELAAGWTAGLVQLGEPIPDACAQR